GVRSVTAAELATLTDDSSGTSVRVEGADPGSSDVRVTYNRVGPDYFSTLGIPLIAGREIGWTDNAAAPKVAVVNESMARRLLAGKNPLGARFAFGASEGPDGAIVGVVRNRKAAKVTQDDGPF